MDKVSEDFLFSNESINELKKILSTSNKQLMKDYADFPINRARGTGLKRNALKLIYEYKLTEMKDFLDSLELPEQLEELRKTVLVSLAT